MNCARTLGPEKLELDLPASWVTLPAVASRGRRYQPLQGFSSFISGGFRRDPWVDPKLIPGYSPSVPLSLRHVHSIVSVRASHASDR